MKTEIDWSAATEEQMRDAEAPRPKTTEELGAFIETMLKREHDYGTCVYAMSLAATAAFNLVAHTLRVTGFQASCADLDILTRTRGMKGPWSIVDYSKALYPQYDIVGDVSEDLAKSAGWLRDEARKLLAERCDTPADPNVMAHWRRLAEAS